jgi:NAD(P)-dependent dehydrogenase (short-subunit alcohol dehydrogenase family)
VENPLQKEIVMPLQGKHALITGSSRGIGRGIALKLAEQRVNIAVHYHTQVDAANETLAQVKAHGAEGCLIQADVTRPEEISRMFDRVQREFSTLDIFVSNARPELAAFYQHPMALTLEQWHTALDSQAQAFLLGVQASARLMPDGGRIIAISYSPSGRTGSWQPWAAMGAAKAALDALVRYFAVALGRRGITVNVVSPGATDDSVVSRLPTEVFRAIKAWHESGWTPMGRVGTPADIGNAVRLLCMDEASFITGQTLHVDGGASIMDPVFPLDIQRG